MISDARWTAARRSARLPTSTEVLGRSTGQPARGSHDAFHLEPPQGRDPTRPRSRGPGCRCAAPAHRGQAGHSAPGCRDPAADEAAAPAPVRPGPSPDLHRGATRLRQDKPARPVGDGRLAAGRLADRRRQRQRPGRLPHGPRHGDRSLRAARSGALRRDRVGDDVEPHRGRSAPGGHAPAPRGPPDRHRRRSPDHLPGLPRHPCGADLAPA